MASIVSGANRVRSVSKNSPHISLGRGYSFGSLSRNWGQSVPLNREGPSIGDVAFSDELVDVMRRFALDSSRVLLINSGALAAWGIGRNRDVDLLVATDAGRGGAVPAANALGRTLLSANVEIKRRKDFLPSLGDEVFGDRYSVSASAVRVLRPETLLAHLALRSRPKDKYQISALVSAIGDRYLSFDWAVTAEILHREFVYNQDSLGRQRNTPSDVAKGLLDMAHQDGLGPTARYAMKALRIRLGRAKPGSHFGKVVYGFSPQSFIQCRYRNADLGDVLRRQFGFESERLDLGIRSAVVRAYLEEGQSWDESCRLYEKMQKARVGRSDLDAFTSLIDSMNTRGFDTKFPIRQSYTGRILDGAHRVSVAGVLGIEVVPVTSSPRFAASFGKKWFEANGFNREEIERARKNFHSLLVGTGAAYQLIVWPPAIAFLEEIAECLSALGHILSVESLDLGPDLGNFCFDIYSIDDIAKWKVETKLQAFQGTKVGLCSFVPFKSNYRIRNDGRELIDVTCESAKSLVRKKFASRVPNYFPDIVIHAADNSKQSRQLNAILGQYSQNR